MFRAHLQGGHETPEACGTLSWLEPEEVGEDKKRDAWFSFMKMLVEMVVLYLYIPTVPFQY